MSDLAALTGAILQRLRDPHADFRLQVYVRDTKETIWLERKGARVMLTVIGAGGGELDWSDSPFRAHDPQRAFAALQDRIDSVALYAGGPFPDDLLGIFLPDESQTLATYRAEWPSWNAFTAWLQQKEAAQGAASS